MTGRFAGKVVVIIGATRGMGAATARRLAREGASVVLGGISVERGEALAEELRAGGGKAQFRRADLYDDGSLADIVEAAMRDHGRLDGLFNNGADLKLIERDGDAVSTDLALFDQSLRVNLRGFLVSVRHTIPHMFAGGGGSIVQTSSNSAYFADATMVSYSCSKAAVDALTRHIAVRWGKSGIRCNTIHPGMTMVENAVEMAEHLPLDRILARTPLPRLAVPEDIAGVAAFLLSDDSASVNGQIITADGGFSVVQNDVGAPDMDGRI